MTNFFLKLKNPVFGLFLAHFSQFLGQKKFFQKIQLFHAQLHKGFLAPCQNSEKTNDPIRRKCLERRKDA